MQEGIILRKYRAGLLAINNLRGGFIRALGRVIPKVTQKKCDTFLCFVEHTKFFSRTW